MRATRAFFIPVVLILLSCKTEQRPTEKSNGSLPPQSSTPLVIIGNDTLTVEISSTPKERARGLMFRDSLPENCGMLFIFEFEARHTFWMKNTRIPLSIAFITSDRIIVDMQDMTPLSLEGCSPRFPCLYALEVNQNWFAAHTVRIGDSVQVHF